MESGGSTFGGGNSNSNKGPVMKAPGGDGSYIPREVFEENPKRYFTDLRAGQNKETQTKQGEGDGGWGTFWKVAGAAAATAVVAGGIYSIVKQMEATRVPVGAGGSGGSGSGSGIGGGIGGCGTIDGDSDSDSDDDGGGDRGIYSIIVREMGANRVPVEAGGSGVAQPKVWTKPKVGWLKLNVDGSLLRKIQSAGCGGVLRNESGKWLIGFAQKLDPSLRVDETEIEGILRGMKWAKEKGFMRVEVESDNEGIVEKVNSWSRSTDPLILAIRELLRSPDWQTTLTSIRRGANGVADKLADIGRNLTSFDLKEYDNPPASCRTAFNNDLRLL